MRLFDGIQSRNLERHEMQLTILACFSMVVLVSGAVLLLYPVVFSQAVSAPARVMTVGFFGLCILSILLALYIVDRQATIGRLRQQIGTERRRSSKVLNQASGDILDALANFNLFQDHLMMEYQRATAGKQHLSVLVITAKVPDDISEPNLCRSVLGNAAKAISRTLRGQDSIYILTHDQFGVILPGVDALAAKCVSARLAEGLTDAAGASNQFSFKIEAISYPEQTSSAHDLELAITQLLPEDSLTQTMTREVLTSR
jgi:GGDEF domain-containing protein